MGPRYEIDEETGEIIYCDESTGWMERRIAITEAQQLVAQTLSEKFWDEWALLLRSMVVANSATTGGENEK